MFFPFLAGRKRRQLIVDKKFQMRYVGTVFWFTVGMIIIGGIFSFLTISLFFIKNGLQSNINEYILLVKALLVTLGIQVLFTAVIVYWEGLYLTHKMVGPMVRIKKALEDIGQGDFAVRVNLRRADEFQDVALWINKMAENLSALQSEGRLNK